LNNTANYNSVSAFMVQYSDNINVLGNNATFSFSGISLMFTDFTNVSDNLAEYNSIGITAISCNNNTFLENQVSFNNNSGIYLGESHNNILSKNNVCQNGETGIFTDQSDNNMILFNLINNNTISGLTIQDGQDNEVSKNNITYNYGDGMYLVRANYTTISGNLFQNNTNRGLSVDNSSESNVIYGNCFIGNNINAWDDGINNLWDNGKIGNFWDDYSGEDGNNNNIGDNSYLIPGSAGSQDNLPLMYCEAQRTYPPNNLPFIITIIASIGIGLFVVSGSVRTIRRRIIKSRYKQVFREESGKIGEDVVAINDTDLMGDATIDGGLSKPKTPPTEVGIVGPPDLKEIEQLESEVYVETEQFTCAIHNGKIIGPLYLCPKCKTYYCMKCALELKTKGLKCTTCNKKIRIKINNSS